MRAVEPGCSFLRLHTGHSGNVSKHQPSPWALRTTQNRYYGATCRALVLASESATPLVGLHCSALGRPLCDIGLGLPRRGHPVYAATPLPPAVPRTGAHMAGRGQAAALQEARELVSDLCRHFYTLGWVSGTGGSISLRTGLPSDPPESRLIVMAPSGKFGSWRGLDCRGQSASQRTRRCKRGPR